MTRTGTTSAPVSARDVRPFLSRLLWLSAVAGAAAVAVAIAIVLALRERRCVCRRNVLALVLVVLSAWPGKSHAHLRVSGVCAIEQRLSPARCTCATVWAWAPSAASTARPRTAVSAPSTSARLAAPSSAASSRTSRTCVPPPSHHPCCCVAWLARCLRRPHFMATRVLTSVCVLQQINVVEQTGKKGGRRISRAGQQALDRIAFQVASAASGAVESGDEDEE